MRKGQYYRLLLSTTANPTHVIAAAKTMSLHGSAQTEESSTKDTTGDDLEYCVTAKSYDITGSALVLTPGDALNTGANSLASLMNYMQNQMLYWRICLMNGNHNRTVSQEICSGTAKLTQLNPSGQNKQDATFSYTLTGYGPIAVNGIPSIVEMTPEFPITMDDLSTLTNPVLVLSDDISAAELATRLKITSSSPTGDYLLEPINSGPEVLVKDGTDTIFSLVEGENKTWDFTDIASSPQMLISLKLY